MPLGILCGKFRPSLTPVNLVNPVSPIGKSYGHKSYGLLTADLDGRIQVARVKCKGCNRRSVKSFLDRMYRIFQDLQDGKEGRRMAEPTAGGYSYLPKNTRFVRAFDRSEQPQHTFQDASTLPYPIRAICVRAGPRDEHS